MRNLAVAGDWSLLSSHGGLNFYIGNNAEADGTYRLVPGITPDITGQQADARRVAEASVGQKLDDAEVSAYFYGLGWTWPEAQIAGIALSTTSVAVVYAVMVETGYNRTELGKIILAACFINDVGTVLALGLVFANYNAYLILFIVATIIVMAVLPRIVPWLFERIWGRTS